MTELAGVVTFREASGEPQVQAVPLGHVSIEVGHLYHEDFGAGPDRPRDHFGQLAPWLAAARAIWTDRLSPKRARISTCFLIDDYTAPLDPPAVVIPRLLEAARETGVAIDYLAREAACVASEGVALARLVEERIVAEPTPGTNGGRPPTNQTGWLSNGRRSPAALAPAMAALSAAWVPPAESATNRHSVFVDVELWDEQQGTRTWSCSFLAAVWQLLRLGLLRSRGAPVAVPQPYDGDLPDDWEGMPAVVQVNPRAAPFTAYRTMSILPRRFIATEHAVRTVLGQVAVEQAVLADTVDRGRHEGLAVTGELVDRIEYVFTG
jgi:hypothetical protein